MKYQIRIKRGYSAIDHIADSIVGDKFDSRKEADAAIREFKTEIKHKFPEFSPPRLVVVKEV